VTVDSCALEIVLLTYLLIFQNCSYVYTVFQRKLDPLLFHHIFALPATNYMKISRSTQEVLLVVNME